MRTHQENQTPALRAGAENEDQANQTGQRPVIDHEILEEASRTQAPEYHNRTEIIYGIEYPLPTYAIEASSYKNEEGVLDIEYWLLCQHPDTYTPQLTPTYSEHLSTRLVYIAAHDL